MCCWHVGSSLASIGTVSGQVWLPVIVRRRLADTIQSPSGRGRETRARRGEASKKVRVTRFDMRSRSTLTAIPLLLAAGLILYKTRTSLAVLSSVWKTGVIGA